MKKGYLNNFVNWILDKLATKVYNQLATSNKTMIGALNELNNLLKTQIIDTRSTNKPPQYYYSNYPQTVVYELKESISVDDPFQAAAFLVLQTITPWCDITAGSVIQSLYVWQSQDSIFKKYRFLVRMDRLNSNHLSILTRSAILLEQAFD